MGRGSVELLKELPELKVLSAMVAGPLIAACRCCYMHRISMLFKGVSGRNRPQKCLKHLETMCFRVKFSKRGSAAWIWRPCRSPRTTIPTTSRTRHSFGSRSRS